MKKKIMTLLLTFTTIGAPTLSLSQDKIPAAPNTHTDTQHHLSAPVIVVSLETAKLASPITGFIQAIHFKPGDSFNQDNALVNFDCTILRAERDKAESSVKNLSVKAKGINKLYKLDAASQIEVSEADSKLAESQQELVIKNYLVNQCEIKAPFKGQIIEVHANNHEYIEQGRPLIDVVNLSELEVKLIIPSDWLSWIKIATPFTVTINETAQQYPAKITRLIYSIDPVSNTITAYGAITSKTEDIKPGMSGDAQFNR